MNLKQARSLKGVAQKDLAKSIGVAQSHISCIEHGRYFPTQQTRTKIEKALGVEVDWIQVRLEGKKSLPYIPKGYVPGEVDVLAAIYHYIDPAGPEERIRRFLFIKSFMNEYEKALKIRQKPKKASMLGRRRRNR